MGGQSRDLALVRVDIGLAWSCGVTGAFPPLFIWVRISELRLHRHIHELAMRARSSSTHSVNRGCSSSCSGTAVKEFESVFVCVDFSKFVNGNCKNFDND